MKKPSISELVLRKVHRPQKANESATFLQLIQRCLVPEVREEVQRYFGKIDCLEAQYPGLDYTFAPHRRRLAYFPWHRRLFRAFDELGLTSDEILSLCTWEGTRAAKERYERESQTTIEITTLDGICQSDAGGRPHGVFHRPHYGNNIHHNSSSSSINHSSSTTSLAGTTSTRRRSSRALASGAAAAKRRDAHDEDVSDDDDDEDADFLEQSVGVFLNQRLMAAADARERGEDVRFDQQWEQWMKEALERDMDLPTILETIRSVSGRPLSSSSSADPISPLYRERETSASATVGSGASSSLQPLRSEAPTEASTSMVAPEPQSYDQLHEMLNELQNSSASISADTAALSALHEDLVSQDSQRNSVSASANHARLSTLVEELQTNTTRLEAENTAMANFLSRSRTERAR